MPTPIVRLWTATALVVAAITSAAPAGDLEPRLLVSGWSSSNVVAYDGSSGASLGALVSTGGGGLNLAHSVRFGPDGQLYVTSFSNNRVLKYDPFDGTFLGIVASATDSPLNGAADALFGPDGNLYVASLNAGQILEYTADGTYVGIFGNGPGGGLVEGLAWGPDDRLYVATGEANGVIHFELDGTPLGNFITPGSGGLNDPHALTWGPDGNLYVSSFDAPRVLRYDPDGVLIDQFVWNDPGIPGDESGGLATPHGLAFDGAGDLYVASFGTNSVKKYDGATGDYISNFAAGGGLSQPTGIVFTVPGDTNGDGRVDVQDLVNVILHWGPCGTPCVGDTNGDDAIDVGDLINVILNFS